MFTCEDGGDGDDVLGKLGFWRGSHVFVLNHEIGSVGAKNPLDEFEAETGDAVSVGNHNVSAISSHRRFQNGFKAFPLPIDTACDVCDDPMVWELRSHCCDLTLEVVFLLCGRHPTVAVIDFRDFRGFVNDFVSSLSTWGCVRLDETVVCPLPYGFEVDFIVFFGISEWHKHPINWVYYWL